MKNVAGVLKKISKFEPVTADFSYVSLSSLNKPLNNSFANEIDQPTHVKSSREKNSCMISEQPSIKGVKDYISKQNYKIYADQLENKKSLLMDNVKKIEKDYESLEGAKVVSKCFLSAMHSAEESFSDFGIQHNVINILLQLHHNWRNFLDFTDKTIKKLKADISKRHMDMKSLRFACDCEKKEMEAEFKKERSKFQTKPIVQNFNMLRDKFTQYKSNVEKEKEEMTRELSVLAVSNQAFSDKLKKLEEDTNIVKTTSMIDKLTNDVHKLQVLIKTEKEEKANLGFRFHTSLEVLNEEMDKKNKLALEYQEKYETLHEAHEIMLKKLEEMSSYSKQYWERVQMSNEDILRTVKKTDLLKSHIKQQHEIIKELNKKINELNTQLKLQREGLVQNKEVNMEGTLFNMVWNDPIAEANNKIKTKSKANSISEDDSLYNINLSNYCYCKPTYFSFVSSKFPTDANEKIPYNPPFAIWLYVAIRGIFDSKYNEVLLSFNKGKEITRFPEFVYSWLGVIDVDKNTRQVKILEYTEQDTIARKNRNDILLGLAASTVSKVWEVNLFKDSLEEKLCLESNV